MRLSRLAQSARISGTLAIDEEFRSRKAEGKDVISLSVGEPDFATPPHVIEAAKAALDAGATRYTPVTGTMRLKQAAALHFKRDLGIDCTPESVIVTAGGKQAIFEAIAATVSEGDEVIVPSPWWVSYPQMVRFAGGQPVPLITHAHHGFRFEASSSGDLEFIGFDDIRIEGALVPEPSSGALVAFGLLIIGGAARRARTRQLTA